MMAGLTQSIAIGYNTPAALIESTPPQDVPTATELKYVREQTFSNTAP